MDTLKSIAVPVTRKASAKPRRAGHPAAPNADHRVGGTVGERRKQPGAVAAPSVHAYVIGQRLMLNGGGNHWARVAAACKVIAVLPHEGGPLLYRVRSEVESFERVVAEADLSAIR